MKIIYSSSLFVLSNLFNLSVMAEVPSFPHLLIVGYGEVVAKPDMAQFSVEVIESTMNSEQTKQAVDNIVDAYLDRLKIAGIKESEISSSNLYLAPKYHYPATGSEPELVGYQASKNITVQVLDLDKLDDYLDIALGDGINHIDEIQLKVKNESQYQQLAQDAAIRDAANKADSLAIGFKRKLGRVWQVSYNTPKADPILVRSMSMNAKKGSIRYKDSTILIQDRVDVIYQLE